MGVGLLPGVIQFPGQSGELILIVCVVWMFIQHFPKYFQIPPHCEPPIHHPLIRRTRELADAIAEFYFNVALKWRSVIAFASSQRGSVGGAQVRVQDDRAQAPSLSDSCLSALCPVVLCRSLCTSEGHNPQNYWRLPNKQTHNKTQHNTTTTKQQQQVMYDNINT